MRRMIWSIALITTLSVGACFTDSSPTSDAEKARQYFEDGVACFERLDFECSMTLLEQVWYINDFSEIDETEWTYYTAESNYLVAIDEDALFPRESKIGSAERAESMFQLLGADFDERRLLLQYFLIRSIEDSCDERRIGAVTRFRKTSAETANQRQFDELKALTEALIVERPDC